MPLIDAAQLDDLAQLCAELKRYSFLLTVVYVPRTASVQVSRHVQVAGHRPA